MKFAVAGAVHKSADSAFLLFLLSIECGRSIKACDVILVSREDSRGGEWREIGVFVVLAILW